MKRITNILNAQYFLILLLALVVAMLSYHFVVQQGRGYSPNDPASVTWYSFIIMYCIVSIPMSLYLLSKKIKALETIEEVDLRSKRYLSLASIRVLWLGSALLISIIGFYFLHIPSLIYLTGICVLSLLFVKPSSRRMRGELNLEADGSPVSEETKRLLKEEAEQAKKANLPHQPMSPSWQPSWKPEWQELDKDKEDQETASQESSKDDASQKGAHSKRSLRSDQKK